MIRIQLNETGSYRKLDPEKDFRYGMQQAVAFTLDPYDGIWQNVSYYGEGIRDSTGSILFPHWVYVLVNPGIVGVCKIGFTTTTVTQRVREINSATGVISPWVPVYSYKCPNGPMLEADVHGYLEDRGIRINPKREGFLIKSEEAIKIIEELGEKYKTL